MRSGSISWPRPRPCWSRKNALSGCAAASAHTVPNSITRTTNAAFSTTARGRFDRQHPHTRALTRWGNHVPAESRYCRPGLQGRASRLAEDLGVAPSPSFDPWQEVADGQRDFIAVRLEREVSRVEEHDLRVLDVTSERLRPWRQEERVSLAPDCQPRWLMPAKILLELRIHLDVARVVEEQIQLDFMRAGSGHVVVVEVVAVGRNQRRVLDAGRVLPVRRLGRQQLAQRVPVGLGRFLPVRAYGVPAVTQPFDIGVAVL